MLVAGMVGEGGGQHREQLCAGSEIPVVHGRAGQDSPALFNRRGSKDSQLR